MARKSSVKKRGRCFICEQNTFVEQHHIIPQSAGGAEHPKYPICVTCHDEIDRAKLDQWDADDTLEWISGLWSKCNRGERLVICKLVSVMFQVKAFDAELSKGRGKK